MTESPGKDHFFARSIEDKDGNIQLYDLYVSIDGGAPEWIGSRRTPKQCNEAFEAYVRRVNPQSQSLPRGPFTYEDIEEYRKQNPDEPEG